MCDELNLKNIANKLKLRLYGIVTLHSSYSNN